MMDHATPIYLWIVLVTYLIFAFEFWRQTAWRKVNRRKALAVASLVVVFVLCGIAHAMGMLDNSWWPIRNMVYMALDVAALLLVLTNRVKILSEMVEE